MKVKLQVFGIAGNKKKALAKKTALRAIEFLKKKNADFLVDSGFLKTKNSLPLKKIRADFFLVFGGDGTLLHVMREMQRQVPVLGINCGTRGHLMAIKPKKIESAIEKIFSGKYFIEQRARLTVFVDGKRVSSALNEIIVAPKQSFTLSSFKVVAGKKHFYCECDAVAIATPTGSTAFALSAGGKKILPNKKVFEVLPVHAFSGIKKPLLVADNSKIYVVPLEKRIVCEAIFDGQKRIAVKKKIVIKQSGKPALFVRLLD